MQRSEGGRGLLSASRQYKTAIINLAHHIENSKDKYIETVEEWDAKESDSIMKKVQIWMTLNRKLNGNVKVRLKRLA